jgi:NADH-quinone oxidoreductase subunit H
MHSAIVLADDIGSQLSHWIISSLFWQFLITLLFAFLFPITSAAIINYLERKVMAWMQDRKGPLHVGPHGSLQLLADIGKMFTKEDVHAAQTDKTVFLLAPSVFIAPMIASFAVLPFSPLLGLPGTALATGIVYLVAMSLLDVIGVVMAGWGSNNKYSLIGFIRLVGRATAASTRRVQAPALRARARQAALARITEHAEALEREVILQ